MSEDRPRYTDVHFPPYSYVPGHFPHPVSDPAGHMHGEEHAPAEPLQPDNWQASEEYRFGIDLFNHGYYWEAHEAWEALWHAAGRKGELASYLKGLIKFAAAGVKAREGNPRGVERHAERSIELLSPRAGTSFCGLEVDQAIGLARGLADTAEQYDHAQPHLLLDAAIELHET